MNQKRSNHKIIIWSTSVSDIIEDNNKVGGIGVQLYFWAQTFARHDWNVLHSPRRSLLLRRESRLSTYSVGKGAKLSMNGAEGYVNRKVE